MKNRFSDLVDVALIERLTDLFHSATGIPAAIVDLDGGVISRSGAQSPCAGFHRVNPETGRGCPEGDTHIANRLEAGGRYTVHRYASGLMDAAVPIAIDGEHIADLFTGQFLFQAPDPDFFREQARACGFDEAAYIQRFRLFP
jgi:ligand-binding sensor protein